ncbi:MAG: hypothetical protein WBQ73_04245 [Candidatus Babeliales bacterium]
MPRNNIAIFSIATFLLAGTIFQSTFSLTFTIDNQTPYNVNVHTQYRGEAFGKKWCKDKHVEVGPHSSVDIEAACWLKQINFAIMKNHLVALAETYFDHTRSEHNTYTIRGPKNDDHGNVIEIERSSASSGKELKKIKIHS